MTKVDRTTRVLSLDGGGVRGLSSLYVLQYLVELVETKVQELDGSNERKRFLPSQIFDHVVGTSTGGLIAVMIVKLNMNIDDCIQAYKDLLPQIFGKRQFGSWLRGLGVPRYSEETFKECLMQVFAKYGRRNSTGEVIRFMEEGNVGQNKSFCTVVCREISNSGRRMHQPAFICSHYCRSTQKETGKYVPYELWMTCRATTAAPTFFAPMKIHGRTLVDGAFGNTNNPTRKAHFHFLNEVTGYKDHPVIWLNIGTGSPDPCDARSIITRRSSISKTKPKQSWKTRLIPKALLEAQNLIRDLQTIATDSDRVEEEMEDIVNSRSNNQPITFARVSANNGVADIQLDDWRGLAKIEVLTKASLKRPQVEAKLRRMADLLAQETYVRGQRRAKGKGKARASWSPPPIDMPWLGASMGDISPLPSPAITVSRPGHTSQHTASLEPSPVSPLTVYQALENGRHGRQRSEDLATDPDMLPVLIGGRGRKQSRSTQDLVADVIALPGMSVPSLGNEKRFSNIGWRRNSSVGSDEKKSRRRTTLF